MSDRLRVAVIGVGNMGRNHARVYSEMPGVELVGVCDVDAARAEIVAHEFGTRGYADFREMLELEQAQAVSVCVPTGQHCKVASFCLFVNVGTLAEKPLAATLEEARHLATGTHLAGRLLQVGHVERFNPAIVELKRQIDAGLLGRIHYLQFTRRGPFSPRQRDVGVVHDLMVHDLDLARWLTGQEMESLTAFALRGIKTPHEDMATATIRLSGGTVALLEADWLSGNKERRILIGAENGTWEADLMERELWHFPFSNKGAHYWDGNCKPEPLRAELDAFVAACRGEAPVAVTGEDGLRALEMCEAVCRAAEGEHVHAH